MNRPPGSTASLDRHKTLTEQRKHLRSEGSVTSMINRSVSGSLYWKPIKKVRKGRDVEEFKKEVNIDDHTLEYEDFLERYQTDINNGLTQSRADELLALNGPNCLVPTAGTKTWKIFCMHLFGGFNAMIWLGSILTFVEFGIKYNNLNMIEIETLALAVVLALTALISGLFAFFHERKHTEIMDSFSKMIPKFACVVRDGKKIIIPSEELVEGDLVEINSGNMVPADMRIMESLNLKVDNSAITGESIALVRSPELSDYNPLETQNLVFYGTCVIEGNGIGIVIRCGHDTVLGHIAGLTSAVEKGETLLRKELNVFVKILSVLAFIIASCLFGLCMGLGYGFFYSFTFFIAIMVANVPEGLPVAFTTCMALTAQRLRERNCLVKKFESIETLGACNVICSDKTGTLTQNKMVASHIYCDGIEYDVINNVESINEDSVAYQSLCTVAILCSRATYITGADGEQQISGDASETGIMKLMMNLVGDIEAIRTQCPKVCEIPFTSATKFQLSIHQLPTKKFVMVMKGAPEKVLEHCATILREGETLTVNPINLKPIKRSILNLGRKGERVLAFADLYLSDKYHPRYAFNAEKINFTTTGLRFVGLIAMLDPPKASVPEAVSKCKTAGIRIIMVTGDHPITASAIARKVGIISTNATSIFDENIRRDTSASVISITTLKKPHTAAILTGSDLNNMSEKELQQVMLKHKEIVFARTSPQQKLKIVEALQHLNFVVAVTGDGVNDSPALKKGDIGIAMGITGSDVSKEAADMILLDDNFASIVTGIEEGRLIFDNLKKSICYELTSNVPEIVPFVMMIALNVPQALSVMAILVIDVGTDLWAAISLVYEKAEADIMKRNPRNPKTDKLINKRLIGISYAQIGVIQTCAAFSCYFFLMAEYGWHWYRLIGIRPEWEDPRIDDLEDSYGQEWSYEARQVLTKKCVSAYFLSIVITQISDLISCKTRRLSVCRQGFGNHVLNAGLMFEIFLAGLIVYCPGLNDAFHFSPISLSALIPAIPFAVFIFAYDELRKYFIRTYPNGFIAKETYY